MLFLVPENLLPTVCSYRNQTFMQALFMYSGLDTYLKIFHSFCLYFFSGMIRLVTTWRSPSGSVYLTSISITWWQKRKKITGNFWMNKKPSRWVRALKILKSSSKKTHVIRGKFDFVCTVRWENFKQNFKNFQQDICRIANYAWGIQNIIYSKGMEFTYLPHGFHTLIDRIWKIVFRISRLRSKSMNWIRN